MRPTDGKPHAPRLRALEDGDPFDIRCLYDNSSIIINTDGSSSSTYFMVSVVWAAGDRLSADPSTRPGSQAKAWNGHAGFLNRSPDDPKSGKACLGMAKLSSGVGGVSITNARFPTDPCVIADGLMAVITARAT